MEKGTPRQQMKAIATWLQMSQQPRLQIQQSNTTRGGVDGSETNKAAACKVIRHLFGDSVGAGRNRGKDQVRWHCFPAGGGSSASRCEQASKQEREKEEERILVRYQYQYSIIPEDIRSTPYSVVSLILSYLLRRLAGRRACRARPPLVRPVRHARCGIAVAASGMAPDSPLLQPPHAASTRPPDLLVLLGGKDNSMENVNQWHLCLAPVALSAKTSTKKPENLGVYTRHYKELSQEAVVIILF
uniref:Uncharacterized protein n=1 Tax=Coccidioides posadasii RMSCC 3488 TaxID=454284 RepID=A0A0J6FE92_COCPO|nr:hypothetical protein CPAG_07768 [Coccidioides posadasii RMSCC 3488]